MGLALLWTHSSATGPREPSVAPSGLPGPAEALANPAARVPVPPPPLPRRPGGDRQRRAAGGARACRPRRRVGQAVEAGRRGCRPGCPCAAADRRRQTRARARARADERRGFSVCVCVCVFEKQSVAVRGGFRAHVARPPLPMRAELGRRSWLIIRLCQGRQMPLAADHDRIISDRLSLVLLLM